MTTTSRDPIVCECGHEGNLKLTENDQPYSGLWEAYSLEGFDGGNLTISNSEDMPKDMLAHLKPTCPECGRSGKVKYKND
jgi:hypothetical protein